MKTKIITVIFLIFISSTFAFANNDGFKNIKIVEDTTIKVYFSTNELNFKYVTPGKVVVKKLILKNYGKSPIQINELILYSEKEKTDTTGFRLEYDWNLNDPIDTNETRVITVKFSHKLKGIFTDYIGLGISDIFKYYVRVFATTATPAILVSDIDFGIKSFESNVRFIGTITNIGQDEVCISNVKLPNSSNFQIDFYPLLPSPSNPLGLSKDGEFQFDVSFTPTEAKTYLDSIVFITCYGGTYGDSVCILRGEGKPNSVKYSNPQEINLKPNPASDYINVDVSFLRMQESAIKIYNIFGECVLAVETIHELSLQRIDVSALPEGIYFVRVGEKIGKFVVVR